MDILTPEQRRRTMAAVKSKDTKPEMLVRRLLHAAGYRFRIHRKDLPGNPDIVLPKYRTVVFVHGCFWHQHDSCKRATRPASSQDYWQKKLDRNVQRDKTTIAALGGLGWRIIVVWECETRNLEQLSKHLISVLQ